MDPATPTVKGQKLKRKKPRRGRNDFLKQLVREYSDPLHIKYHPTVSVDPSDPETIFYLPTTSENDTNNREYKLETIKVDRPLPPLAGIDIRDPRFEEYQEQHIQNGTYAAEAKINE